MPIKKARPIKPTKPEGHDTMIRVSAAMGTWDDLVVIRTQHNTAKDEDNRQFSFSVYYPEVKDSLEIHRIYEKSWKELKQERQRFFWFFDGYDYIGKLSETKEISGVLDAIETCLRDEHDACECISDKFRAEVEILLTCYVDHMEAKWQS